MVSRDFRGFPNLQEVECFGDNVDSELSLTSLKLVKLPEKEILAVLRTDTETCLTFTDYTSCGIDTESTHKSRLRVLVHDLREGEGREYGCTATTINAMGDAVYKTWKIIVTVKCKY